jgi:hypothetical protein
LNYLGNAGMSGEKAGVDHRALITSIPRIRCSLDFRTRMELRLFQIGPI